jgi:hypothetical protein
MREMREKFGVEVKAFTPAFVIPRHAPGWETLDGAEAEAMIFARPSSRPPMGDRGAEGRRPVNIEIRRGA